MPAVRVERLSKLYRIDRSSTQDRCASYWTLRDDLMRIATLPVRRLSGARPPRLDDFWALNDVSFEVGEGEVVGIIGRNGAGKSTLLKILSRITRPTAGRVELRGRIGSLLEVGTGFHPELSGRDNIYLNGTLLGMGRAEIGRRFDEIVAFAEVESFLDTPVKRYSSGMYVRLAFAVAAHLETEILMVDEVLAVGDVQFQKKCLGKLKETTASGRTALFVSHNMSTVLSLCDSAVVLDRGSATYYSDVAEASSSYLRRIQQGTRRALLDRTDRSGRGATRLREVDVVRTDGGGPLTPGAPCRIVFRLTEPLPELTCRFTIYDEMGRAVVNFDSSCRGPRDASGVDRGEFACEIDSLCLLPGRYYVNVSVDRAGEAEDRIESAVELEVHDGLVEGRQPPRFRGYGCLALPHRWFVPGGEDALENPT